MVLCSMLAVLKQAQTGVRAKSGKSTAVVPALFVVHDHDALHIDVLLLHILAHPDRCGRCCDIFMFLNSRQVWTSL